MDALPDDIGKIAHAVQMLLVHRWWAPAYGVEVTPERETENGLHGTEAMLAKAMEKSAAKIGEVRLPDKRVVGICRHFSTMMAAFLKRKGIPARARCGFATYFEPPKYVDHWVAEYWKADESRWVQVDAQLDTLQEQAKKIDFDPLDTPRDRFLVGGDVWLQYRMGDIDANLCGILDMWGDWYIRGNHALDVASLQKVELLPWEPFGIAKSPGSTIGDTPELLALVDRTAELTAMGDDASVVEAAADGRAGRAPPAPGRDARSRACRRCDRARAPGPTRSPRDRRQQKLRSLNPRAVHARRLPTLNLVQA